MELLLLWETILRWKKVFLTVFLGFFFFVALTTLIMQSVYKAKTVLIVNDASPMTTLLSSLQIRSETRRSSMEDPYGADLAMVTAEPVLRSVINDLKLKTFFGSDLETDDFTEKKLLRKILPQPYVEADLMDDTDQLITIIALSPDPQQATDIANGVAKTAISFRNDLMRRDFAAIRESLTARLSGVGDQYYQALVAARDFRVKTGAEAVELSSQAQALISKIRDVESEISSNDNAIVNAEAQNVEAKALLTQIDELRQASIDYSPSQQRTSLENLLVDKLVTFVGQAAELTKAHPQMKSLNNQINEIKHQLKKQPVTSLNTIQKSINPVYDSLKDRIQQNTVELQGHFAKQKNLSMQLDAVKQQLIRIPEIAVTDDRLSTDLSAAKTMYQDLKEYLLKATVAESVATSELSVVESATVPTERNFPSKKINFSLGFIVGLFLALMSVLLLEYIDRARTIRKHEASLQS
ncbi:GumC family protein [Desulfovibrio inopinatus]|uniref:GumC family protein n=1 Tax=Desulfovibrio inopinatus TaxID=102109 RepID=UPI0003F4FF2B|nr:hypothetical protein [Desulfovibrio inopinatus]